METIAITVDEGGALLRAANLDDRSRPRFVATGAAQKGPGRATNEDTARLLPELGLFVVADGMSEATGDGAGAEAAELAASTIAEDFALEETTVPSVQDLSRGVAAGMLCAAIAHADRRVCARGTARGRPGMGTTIAALLVAGPRVVIAHVGDSRAYLLRAGKLARLTRDHTEVVLWEQMHQRRAPEAMRVGRGHVLTRVVGGRRQGAIADVRVEPWKPGDLYVLTTDGLHGAVTDSEMVQTIAGAPDLDCAVVRLMKRALAAGAQDDATAVLVRMLGA